MGGKGENDEGEGPSCTDDKASQTKVSIQRKHPIVKGKIVQFSDARIETI